MTKNSLRNILERDKLIYIKRNLTDKQKSLPSPVMKLRKVNVGGGMKASSETKFWESVIVVDCREYRNVPLCFLIRFHAWKFGSATSPTELIKSKLVFYKISQKALVMNY